jgi:hypothetical protein
VGKAVAKPYSSLSKADIEGILKKTVTVAADRKFEPFKTTPIFDSTAAHPEWLGYAAQAWPLVLCLLFRLGVTRSPPADAC